jgi:hypothetical protein
LKLQQGNAATSFAANQNCTMVVATAITYHHEKKTVATPYRHKKA